MIQLPHPQPIKILPLGLEGSLTVPDGATGIVLFAHGSGSSRLSPRNTHVARALNKAGLATLLFDLLSPSEAYDRHKVFDIPLLAGRLEEALNWIEEKDTTADLNVGLFGASTGAAAALTAAARRPFLIRAIVSRGGRPDLAANALADVQAPTLLIVGERDTLVVELNRRAIGQLACPTRLELVRCNASVRGARHAGSSHFARHALVQATSREGHRRLAAGTRLPGIARRFTAMHRVDAGVRVNSVAGNTRLPKRPRPQSLA